MPDRRTHMAYALRFIEEYGLEVPVEAASIIETIIDHPGRIPKLLWERIRKTCEVHPMLEARINYGMRARGIASHDWRSPVARRVLHILVGCLYGPQASLLVELHHALDDLWEGRTPTGYSDIVISFLASTVSFVDGSRRRWYRNNHDSE